MTTASIAVGADARASSLAALAWALAECRSRDSDLVLVHALDAADAELACSGGPANSSDAVAHAVLDVHRAVTEGVAHDVKVSSHLSEHEPAEALIEASQNASLLVLGSHGLAGFAESALGSIAHRVAVHAHCPVAIVPAHSTTPRWLQLHRIVVGVSETRAARQAVHFAAAEARRGDATLVLVRAPVDGEDDGPDGDAVLNGFRDEVRHCYPDVRCEAVLAGTDPVSAVVRAARDADLVVLGCHHSDAAWNCRLGAVPTGVLMQVECPVVLVGQVH
jgi:nucleotide-binding universal stress UspA family protein